LIYEFECPEHGLFDRYLSMRSADLATSECETPGCLLTGRRIYGSGYGGHVIDFWYGEDPTSGRHFDSKAEMIKDAAERGHTLHRT
jgi:hypothetical protein